MADFKVGEGGILTGYSGSATAVMVPPSVSKIGYAAFSDMAIQTVAVPSSVTEVRDAAFAGCASLGAVTGLTTLGYIGHDALSGTQVLSNPYDLAIVNDTLTWSAPLNTPTGVSNYRVYVNGTSATTSARTYSLSSLAQGTTHAIRVAAVSGAEGISSSVTNYLRMSAAWPATPASTTVASQVTAMSADGNRVVLSDASGSVKVYDVSSNGSWLPRATLSAIGTSLAISAAGDTVIATSGISVRIFKEVGGTWSKVADISGNANQANAIVAISADGSTAVLGCPAGDGCAYIYRSYNGAWSRVATLGGEPSSAEKFGGSVAISTDGSIIAIGARDALGKGAVRIFSGHLWNKKVSLYGENGSNELFGYSISMSADGATIAVGAPCSGTRKPVGSAIEEGYGTVSIWTRSGAAWSKQATLYGAAGSNEKFGSVVALSAAGTTLAVSGPGYASGVGRTQIFAKNLSNVWPLVATYNANAQRSMSLSGTGDRVLIGEASRFVSASYRASANQRFPYPSYTALLAAKSVTNAATATSAAIILAGDLSVVPSESIATGFAAAMIKSHAALACLLIAGNKLPDALSAAKAHINTAATSTLQFTAGQYIDLSSSYISLILSSMGTGNVDATYAPTKLHVYFPTSSTFEPDTERANVLYCLAPDTLYTFNGGDFRYQRRGDLQKLLLDLPGAATYIPPSGIVLSPASTQWRLTNIYRDVSSSTTTLEECAAQWQQKIVSDPTNYQLYYTLGWISVDLLLTTQEVGKAYAKIYTPMIRGLGRIAAFSDGGAEAEMPYIPAGYFANAADGSVVMPETISLTRTKPVKSIANGAFGANVKALILNGVTYSVANGSVTPAYTYYPPLADANSIIIPTTEERELDLWLSADAPAVEWGNTKPVRYGALQYPSIYNRIINPPALADVSADRIKFLLTSEFSAGPTRIYEDLPDFVKQIPRARVSIPYYHHTDYFNTTVKRAFQFTSADLSAGQVFYYGNIAWVNGASPHVHEMLTTAATNGVVYVMPDAVGTQPYMFGEWAKSVTEIRNYTYSDPAFQSSPFPQVSEFNRTSNATPIDAIAPYAFKNCVNLKAQSFNPQSSVGASAYENCKSLQSITIRTPSALTIGANAFRGCAAATALTIDCSGALTIAAGAFSGCAGLLNVTIHSTGSTISTSAFTGCVGIRTIDATNLHTQPFSLSKLAALKTLKMGFVNDAQATLDISNNSASLESIEITGGAALTLPHGFCNNYTKLTAVDIECKTLGSSTGSFTSCTDLSSISIAVSSNTADTEFSVGSTLLPALSTLSITGNVKVTGDAFWDNSVLKNLRIQGKRSGSLGSLPPSKIESINVAFDVSASIVPYRFKGYTALKQVSIGPHAEIGEGAFFGCETLHSIDLNTTEAIGDWAFARTGLSGEVIIPSSVVSLGRDYLIGCPNLKKITYLCNVDFFEDPSRFTTETWGTLLYKNTSNVYDISGTAVITATSDISGGFKFTSNSTTTVIDRSNLSGLLDWNKYMTRFSNMEDLIRTLGDYYRSLASPVWLQPYIFKFKDLGNDCQETFGPLLDFSSAQWGISGAASIFTLTEQKAMEMLPDQASKDKYMNEISPTIKSYFNAAKAANDTIMASTPSASTKSVTKPYTIPASDFTLSLVQSEISTITGDNALVDICGSGVHVVWKNPNIILKNNSMVEIKGTMSTSFTANAIPGRVDLINWISTNSISLGRSNSVDICIRNQLSTIEYLDHKKNALIDISCATLTVHKNAMTNLNDCTVYISSILATLDNNAFDDCSGTTFNMKFLVTPNAGVNLFTNSINATVNSDKFLINTPTIHLVEFGSSTLDDIPYIIEKANTQRFFSVPTVPTIPTVPSLELLGSPSLYQPIITSSDPSVTYGAVRAGSIIVNSITSQEISLLSDYRNIVQITGHNPNIRATSIRANTLTTEAYTFPSNAPSDQLFDVSASSIHVKAINVYGKLQAGSVVAEALSAGSINANTIYAKTVTSSGTITVDDITADSITAGSLDVNHALYARNIVVNENIQAASITAGMLQAGSINANKLYAQTVTSSGTITVDDISAETITADTIIVKNNIYANTINARVINAKRIFVSTRITATGSITADYTESLEIVCPDVSAANIHTYAPFTRDVEVCSFTPPTQGNQTFPNSYTYIKYQEIPSLKQHIIMQKPEDWFWAYNHSDSYVSNTNTTLRYLLPKDLLVDVSGLTNMPAYDSFTFYGHTFIRKNPFSSTHSYGAITNTDGITLRAVKTTNPVVKEALYNYSITGELDTGTSYVFMYVGMFTLGILLAIGAPYLAGTLTPLMPALFGIGAATLSSTIAAIVSAGLTVGLAFLQVALENDLETGVFTLGDNIDNPFFFIMIALSVLPLHLLFKPALTVVKGASRRIATTLARLPRRPGFRIRDLKKADDIAQAAAIVAKPSAPQRVPIKITPKKIEGVRPVQVTVTEADTSIGRIGTLSIPDSQFVTIKQLPKLDTTETVRFIHPPRPQTIPKPVNGQPQLPDIPRPPKKVEDIIGDIIDPVVPPERIIVIINRNMPDPPAKEVVRLNEASVLKKELAPSNSERVLRLRLQNAKTPEKIEALNAQIAEAKRRAAEKSYSTTRSTDVSANLITLDPIAYFNSILLNDLLLAETTRMKVSSAPAVKDLATAARENCSFLQTPVPITLTQLAAYNAQATLPSLAQIKELGNYTELTCSYAKAYETAAMATAPAYVFPIKKPSDFVAEIRKPSFQIQNFLGNGTNYDHLYNDRAPNGLPCMPYSTANPLLTVGNHSYMWKETFLGPATTAGNRERNQLTPELDDHVNDILTIFPSNSVDYSVNQELYLGNRTVDYTVVNTEVPNLVYSGARNLTIIVPEPITEIPNNAFSGTDGKNGIPTLTLESVDIANTVTKIGDRAFYRSSLKSLTYPSTATFGTQAFANTDIQTLTAKENGANVTENLDLSGSLGWYRIPIVCSPSTQGLTVLRDVSQNIYSLFLRSFTSGQIGQTLDPLAFGTLKKTISNGDSNWLYMPTVPEDFTLTGVTSATYSYALAGGGTRSGTMTNLPASIFISNYLVDYTAEVTGNALIVRYTPPFTGTIMLSSTAMPLASGMNITIGMIGGQSNSTDRGYNFTLTFNLAGATMTMTTRKVTVGSTMASGNPLLSRALAMSFIAPFAFMGSQKLTRVDISPSCTGIGECAFKDCVNLRQDIMLPSGFTTLGAGAFANTAIRSISIPPSVIDIGDDAIPPNTTVIVLVAEDGAMSPALALLPSHVGKVLVASMAALDSCMDIIPDLAVRVDQSPLPPRALEITQEGPLTVVSWAETVSPLASPATHFTLTYTTASGTDVSIDTTKNQCYIVDAVSSVSVVAHNAVGSSAPKIVNV